MLELLIADLSMSDVAAGLNQRGYRNRQGAGWTPVEVFNMLPRLVEAAPGIFPSDDWSERRQRILKLVGAR